MERKVEIVYDGETYYLQDENGDILTCEEELQYLFDEIKNYFDAW